MPNDFFSTFDPEGAVKDVTNLAMKKYQLDQAANQFQQEMGMKKQALDMETAKFNMAETQILTKNKIQQAVRDKITSMTSAQPTQVPDKSALETSAGINAQAPTGGFQIPATLAPTTTQMVRPEVSPASMLSEMARIDPENYTKEALLAKQQEQTATRLEQSAQELRDYRKESNRIREEGLKKPEDNFTEGALAYRAGTDPKAKAALELIQKGRMDVKALQAGGGAGVSPLPGGMSQTPTDPGKMNEGVLEGLSAEDKNYVKALVAGTQDMPKGTALKDKHIFSLVQRAGMYDPTFNAATFDVRKKGNLYFTTGKGGEQLKGLNTAVGHIDSLIAAKDALNNGDWQSINKAENLFAKYLPVTKGLVERQGTVTSVKTKFNAVKGEMASIFKQSGATDQEIKSWEDTLGDPATATPTEWKAFIDGGIELMGSRMGALRNQWETTFQKQKDISFLSPQSRAILQKNKIDINKIDPTVKSSEGNAPGSNLPAFDVAVPKGTTWADLKKAKGW